MALLCHSAIEKSWILIITNLSFLLVNGTENVRQTILSHTIMNTQNIILDSHTFNTDTTLLAQYEGGGRKIYRHSSNEGSVIEFDYWGTWTKLFVADARYRATNLAYDTTVRPHGNPQLTVTKDYFNGSADDDAAALTYTKDDAWIQDTYDALKNDGTARSNTDFLMRFDTTQAAHHCRNQNISGVGQLDLPNFYELIILYLESDNIDALDPTAESNRDKALGMMGTKGRFDFGNQRAAWSSTESGSDSGWRILYNGSARDYYGEYSHIGVVPVKELDA